MHPAIPSEHDLAVALPEFSYLILSAFEDVVISVRSWRLNGIGTFSEETIQYL
jgi:proteasome lid subunit RPN8/RPN11